MKKEKKWYPMSIRGKKMQEFADWLNKWGNMNKHNECLDSLYTIGEDKKPNHITDYGRGYKRAISDIFDRLDLNYKK